MNLVLANRDYGPATDGWGAHTSDEGLQIQLGLGTQPGWGMVGAGYGDGCADVPTLVERHAPAAVFISDKRDWSPDSPGCFRPDVGFARLGYLRERPDVFRAAILKDAASAMAYHREFFQEAGADAAVVYYHPDIVRRLNPWLGGMPLLRVYHSVDSDRVSRLEHGAERKRAVVTGATSAAYPLRTQLFNMIHRKRALDIEAFGHPGYRNAGAHTPAYLQLLARYRVHVATASRYGFALRKIIESVAVGATPVTDLPAEDVLPEIDGALVRIPPGGGVRDVLRAVERADAEWRFDERLAWAQCAREYYDYRAAGRRLADAIDATVGTRNVAA